MSRPQLSLRRMQITKGTRNYSSIYKAEMPKSLKYDAGIVGAIAQKGAAAGEKLE